MLYQYLLYLILLVGYIIILWPSGYAIRRFLENFEFENIVLNATFQTNRRLKRVDDWSILGFGAFKTI